MKKHIARILKGALKFFKIILFLILLLGATLSAIILSYLLSIAIGLLASLIGIKFTMILFFAILIGCFWWKLGEEEI